MMQRQRTYQAKTFVPVVSAAIDPYEEERSSLVDDERLDRWFHYVDAELQRYRSPFVAAEALLTELRQHNKELYQPERLYVNSALRILQACVPHLSAETAAVVSAAIHELLPCLLYTRRTPLTTTTSTTTGSTMSTLASSTTPVAAEQVTQLTYAGAFRRILARWQQCRAQLAQQERHVRVEVKVMDRVVHELDHMWVKTCFYSWRTYCRQLQVRKAQLRRRLIRATANEAAPRFLRAWRQHAHTLALDAKTSRASALQQEVEALYPLEHEAKSRHDHLSEEVKEKNRLVGESLQRLEETQERLRVLEELTAETQDSLADHWSTWKTCMQHLFGDVGTLPGKSDRAVRTSYLMNITDSAAALEQRARTKAGRQGLQHIGKLLLYENALGVCPRQGEEEDGENGTNAPATQPAAGSSSRHNSSAQSSTAAPPSRAATSSRSASLTNPHDHTPRSSLVAAAVAAAGAGGSHSGRASRSIAAVLTPYTTAALTEDVQGVYAAVAAVSRPVLSPLLLTDVLHHNEAQLSLTIAFLTTLYSGGHCSLFVPALRLKEHGDAQRRRTASAKDAAAGPAALAVAETPQPAPEGEEEVHWGALMVKDVSDGMQKVQRCTDANERYLMSVRQCMMSSEVEIIQGYLEDLFARWSTTGVPLSQAKLESVWEPIVAPVELPIIKALYPAQGIMNFAELVDYVTRVAEFSGRPLLTLAERLDATYPYDPLDELRIFLHSDEAIELFRAYADKTVLLFNWLKDETAPSHFRSDHLATLLEERLGLAAEEVEEVSAVLKRDKGDVMERDDVEWLLLVAASYVDPSPFSTLLEKLTTVYEECTPLFTQLSKLSTAKTKTKDQSAT